MDQWLVGLHEGVEGAYRHFFENYYQVLGVFAMKYVKDKNVAEDIVNDVIVGLYTRRPRFDNLTALKSFLFTSIRNRCINIARDDKVRKRYLESAPREEFFLDNILEEEIYFLLKKKISTLPEYPRKVYELSLQGASNEEIAEKLSLTVDSVKSHKKRGKQILKEKLKGLMAFMFIEL